MFAIGWLAVTPFLLVSDGIRAIVVIIASSFVGVVVGQTGRGDSCEFTTILDELGRDGINSRELFVHGNSNLVEMAEAGKAGLFGQVYERGYLGFVVEGVISYHRIL
jgi:hypothetical protein